MRTETGDLWTWDDERVAARVFRTHGTSVLTEHPDGNRFEDAMRPFISERNDKYGEHVHSFEPNPARGRDYWLVTFPVEDERRSAAELLVWVWAMLPEGTVVMPPATQPVADIFDTAARIDQERVESIGDRFVEVKK